jgi:hypothetical protein
LLRDSVGMAVVRRAIGDYYPPYGPTTPVWQGEIKLFSPYPS